MSLEVEVDRDTCMGSGNCVFRAPGAFDLDADGIVVVVDPAAAPEASVIQAARQCPTHAITIRERT